METKAIQNMPIERLVCCSQVRERFDEESLAGLAQTLKETGILQPLLVRRDGSEFVVLEGERRLRAAKMAGLRQVPVIIDDRELSEAEVVYRQLVVNCSREGLEPLEKARAIQRLVNGTNQPAGDVAVRLGMSPGTVSKLLALLKLPESVQAQIAGRALSLSAAYALSHAPDAETQELLAAEAANGGLTRDDVVVRARAHRAGRRKVPTRHKRAVRRERINIPIGDGRSISVAGPSLTLSEVIEWLSDLVKRLRGVQGPNVEVSEAVKMVASQR